MENGLNNFYMNTKSQKFSRIVPIKNHLIDLIDSNQKIKRLSRYMTTTPLLPKGKTYDGKIVNQPDIVGSLKEKIEANGDHVVSEKVIYPNGFSEDVVDDDRLTIYVHCPRTTINNNAVTGRRRDDVDDYTGRHLFYIEIVYPLEYNNIEPYGEERAMSIACEIADMIDEMYIGGETREVVGDCRFKIEGEILNKRLSVTGYGILVMPVWVTTITTRLKAHLVER